MSTAFVIHAGLPKTGTTYLQQRLVDNREWLRGHGVHYPTIGQEVGPGHHNLAQLFRGEPVDQAWATKSPAECLQALPDPACGRVLLSSETFSSLSPQQASALKAALQDNELCYVLHLRRRSALAFSRWQEEVKHGSVRSFAEFLSDQMIGVGSALRIGEPVEVAIQAFGATSLKLIVFEELVARGADLFDHFVEQVLGLDPAHAVPANEAATNVSLPPPVVETLRALNAANANGELWAHGRTAFVQAAHTWLHSHQEGQALLAEVQQVFALHADELKLDKLDEQWAFRDHMILGACRDQVLNASGEWLLFPKGSAKPARALRPSVLHQHIAFARFAAASQQIRAKFLS